MFSKALDDGCFEGVGVLLFLFQSCPPFLEYLNPKHMQCTVLSCFRSRLSPTRFASHWNARGESESAHTQNLKRSAKKTKTRKKGLLWCAFVCWFPRVVNTRTHTKSSFLREAFYTYVNISLVNPLKSLFPRETCWLLSVSVHHSRTTRERNKP